MKTRAEVYERENNGTLKELNKGKRHYLNKNLIEVINSRQNWSRKRTQNIPISTWKSIISIGPINTKNIVDIIINNYRKFKNL